MKKHITFLVLVALFVAPSISAQHSVARQWNDILIESIRKDFARPTVHARNLYHTSIMMYDLWAMFDDTATTFMLDKNVDAFTCPFDTFPTPSNIDSARNEAISYASYRLLKHRFAGSPGAGVMLPLYDALLEDTLGYDKSIVSVDYSTGSAAALGNYMANCMISFGYQDGANELGGYANNYYQPTNPPLLPEFPANPTIVDPNRWQPLALQFFIDQSGNPFPYGYPDFLGPEWGKVVPFALTVDDLEIKSRDGSDWWVYHDPGTPPKIDLVTNGGLSEEYKWGFEMVAIWASHLDPADTTMIDISPNSFGNFDISLYPDNFPDYRTVYDSLEGGDIGIGRPLNPVTGMPYDSQFVKRGDYARVLAEFWADGPDSETPPGHWFTLLNYVNDHPMFIKKYQGEGPVLDDLEWDVKAYFMLAGTVHDAAVAAWGVKGFHDYLRPISAIRMMCDLGQCTDSNLPNYHVAGIHLLPGYIENVLAGDDLEGDEGENINKIKLYTWRGPDYIIDPDTDTAGVGWILAENWWPYQRPTFVTPPFAGYVSGHSTFSRAAAEIMTLLTGTEYFPGGMGEFFAPKDSFLVFEKGPSEDLTLQWATYQDASDQTSLSRIWGGIHPPADDIPGRLMGYEIGHAAFQLADDYFNGRTMLYVDKDAVGDSTGIDWTNACTDLTSALAAARKSHAITEIRLAGGTYFPVDTSRSNSFETVSGVTIRGGFSGNILDPDERDIDLYPTILSGAIGTGADTDNSYHVVRVDGLDNHSIIDGVTIIGGYADGPDAADQKGAGIYNEGQLHLIDVTISNCSATGDGQSIYNLGGEADLTLSNCTINE